MLHEKRSSRKFDPYSAASTFDLRWQTLERGGIVCYKPRCSPWISRRQNNRSLASDLRQVLPRHLLFLLWTTNSLRVLTGHLRKAKLQRGAWCGRYVKRQGRRK